MEKTTVEFRYDALSPSLEEQANRQEFTLGRQSKRLETLNQSRLMLFMNSLISDSVSENIVKRINEIVVKSLKPIQEGGTTP